MSIVLLILLLLIIIDIIVIFHFGSIFFYKAKSVEIDRGVLASLANQIRKMGCYRSRAHFKDMALAKGLLRNCPDTLVAARCS